MRVYRITARQYANDPLNGIGAASSGARWNSKGVRMGYTGSTRSLVTLEMLVHVSRDSVPTDRVMVLIDIPDDAIVTLDPLPRGWDKLLYDTEVQAVGDAWIRRGDSLALRVPSAVVRQEFNILVNPAHARFREVVVAPHEPLVLDQRLFD
jgi:RES domain-containing protein